MQYSEEQLIKMIVEGDNEAFGVIIEKYQNKAYAIALRILQNHDDALDAVQDSFIKAFRNMKQFNFQSSFNTWLYRIVTNTSLDLYRKNKKYIYDIPFDKPITNEDDDDYYIQVEDEKSNIEAIVEKKDTVSLVNHAISMLPDDFKEIVILFDIEQLSLNEVSEILKIPLGTVKSRLFRAREKLAKILKKEGTF
ncbi:MAG: sigma-70 family RNA polymerase sigma factor [Clostridia bacterium]|jgi:RNA polymerase sigma-70 factor (ECF subfamily)